MSATNNNSNNSNIDDSHAANSSKMTNSKTCSIKIHFEGDSRDVDLPASATLAGLQAAVASTFSVDLPPRSDAEEAGEESNLSFTYKDSDGDSIVFDKDSELRLALRLCPESLEIFAARKNNEDKKHANKDMADPEGRLYKIAARNLREYHGVPSMTPVKLTKTVALLKLSPRRLVKQGLAPKKLLKAVHDKKATQQPLGGGDSNEDLAESVAADMEVMALEEDDKKEWNDGFVDVHQPASGCDGEISASPSDDGRDENAAAGDAPGVMKKNLLHKAFVDGGVQLRPREVRPLLLALAVKPCRLARLGLVDAKDLRAMLHAERKMGNKRFGGRGRGGVGIIGHAGHHHPHHPRRQGMAGGGPGGPPHGPSGPSHRGLARPAPLAPGMMARGGGGGGRRGPGGPGAVGKMMRRHHAHPPPPPPPHMGMEEDGGGMYCGVPARAGLPGAGRRGGRRAMHQHPYPHPHHSHHQPPHHEDGMEEGEEGPGFYHGPPPGMRMRMRMHRARNGGGGSGQQAQHGYQYWG